MHMSASSEASVTPPADRKFKVGHRFRGFLPVVADVETGGFNSQTDALLEIAAVILGVDEHGKLFRRETSFAHVTPFRSEEHTSELQSLMRISYAVFCLKKKKPQKFNVETISVTSHSNILSQ